MTAMPLPAPLQAWHPWLSWFKPELAAELGDVLRRMHPLLGRFQGRRQGGVPEPDGVEDLRRRGSYERLLSSEWLLATELPDEFLRRAAGGEHLFLAPRPRAKQAERLIVAVFDAGPWQLGAPRLAQLALWILLARRAAEAGGDMRWGVLHKPGHWHEAGTPEQLKEMLRARTYESAGAEQWRQWSSWIKDQGAGVGECWLIGHEVDSAHRLSDPPTHTVQVRQGLEGESLDVALRAGTAVRALRLPLPSPRPAALLLKGRFQSEAPADAHRQHSQRLSLTLDPIISPSGTWVAASVLDGQGAMIFGIPVPGRRKYGKPKHQQWSRGAEPLCASFAGKTLGAVLSHSQQLLFWQMPPLDTQPRPSQEAFKAPPGRGALLPCIWHRGGGHVRLYVLDAAHRLVYWVSSHAVHNAGRTARGPMLMDKDVLAIAGVSEQRVVYACREDGQLWIRFAGPAGREKTRHRLAFGLSFEPEVFLAGGARWNQHFGSCAVRMSEPSAQARWRVYEAASEQGVEHESWEVQLVPGGRVVGLTQGLQSAHAALIVQAANRRDFHVHSKQGAELMYSAPAPVERASVCPTSGVVAMLTRQRELHVYSVADKSIRLVAHGGGVEAPSEDDAA
jgi:hypothetical protein